MDYRSSFAVSAAGMGVERLRLEAAALNLAHANQAQAPGAGFVPVRVSARPGFGGLVDGALPFASPDARLETMDVAPRRVREVGHPLADAEGFVSYPAVDPAAEMVSLLAASRAYEANLAAMGMARTLALKVLELGRGG